MVMNATANKCDLCSVHGYKTTATHATIEAQKEFAGSFMKSERCLYCCEGCAYEVENDYRSPDIERIED